MHKTSTDSILNELRAFGLTYPGAETKRPWPDHDDLAVNGKTFAYLTLAGEPFRISLKLPFTRDEALKLRCAKPTGYGLGKSGWVTFEPSFNEMPSLEDLKSWLDESYRAQAPKKLAAQITHKVAPATGQLTGSGRGDGGVSSGPRHRRARKRT